MGDPVRIFARGVDRRMDHVTRVIDPVFALAEDLAVDIDLDQARCGDFLEHQAIGVDQEMLIGAGHARRNVRVEEIIEAMDRRHAVECGEIDAGAPFGIGDAGGARVSDVGVSEGGGAFKNSSHDEIP